MALKKCRECGTEVSTSAKTCPKCGIKNPTTAPATEALKAIPGIILIGAVLYYFFVPASGPSSRQDATQNVARYTTPQKVDADAPPLPAGSQQQRFVDIVRGAKADYDAAVTDLQKGATRPARASRICSAFDSIKINNWVGTISELSTNSEGKGVLYIDIGSGIKFVTWNNSISDISTDTLIPPSSSLFNNLLTMQKGDHVSFSGSLFKDQTDCFKETSLTLRGSVRTPEFLFKFSGVTKM